MTKLEEAIECIKQASTADVPLKLKQILLKIIEGVIENERETVAIIRGEGTE